MKKNAVLTLRRLLALLAALALVVSLAGCMNDTSKDPDDEPSDSPSQSEAADPTDAPADPTEPEETEPPVLMGTVTHDNLNVRSNPSTDSTILKKLDINTRVVIMETKTIGEVNWGRIADGWINLSYVLLDGEDPADPTEPEGGSTVQPNDKPVSTGTITADELNIRKGPGTGYDKVGSYKEGNTVDIYEVKDGWARTDKGWISMKHVKLVDEAGKDDDKTDEKDDTPDIDKEPEIESDGKTKVKGYGVVDSGSLNVRTGPGTKYEKIGEVARGQRFAYYQKSGSWVRIEKGWISTNYFYIEGNEGDDATTGTITTDLNIRTGPGKDFDRCGTYKEGKKVEILHQINGWGYTEEGWVSMKYVDTGDKDTEKPAAKTGTITGSDVNIRKGPGTSYESVGKYQKGDKIEILETKDGWARTDKGWVILDYVKVN